MRKPFSTCADAETVATASNNTINIFSYSIILFTSQYKPKTTQEHIELNINITLLFFTIGGKELDIYGRIPDNDLAPII